MIHWALMTKLAYSMSFSFYQLLSLHFAVIPSFDSKTYFSKMKAWIKNSGKLGLLALIKLGLVVYSLVNMFTSPTSDRMNLFMQIILTIIFFIQGVNDLLKWHNLRRVKPNNSNEKDL